MTAKKRRKNSPSSFDMLAEDMGRCFDSLLPRRVLGMPAWTPSVDLSETDKDVVIRVDIPGMDAEQLKISVTGAFLIIKGKKKTERYEEGERCLHVERSYGEFSRSVTLPFRVDADKSKAKYKDGVLLIIVPKGQGKQTKEIIIEEESE